MKIKKVDDKPMVIHTKEKAKIHAHEPKGAKIKGSNIYTVERGPKTISASNYYDIMAVYMVKHDVGDTATVMNDTSKGWLQAVVNDMCSYTTSTGTKDVEETDADGNVTTVTKSVLYVNDTLKLRPFFVVLLQQRTKIRCARADFGTRNMLSYSHHKKEARKMTFL